MFLQTTSVQKVKDKPKGKQRQLKSSFIKTLFESKNVKNITFHYLQQLVDIYNNI